MHVYFTHGDTMTTSRWDGRTSFRVSRFFGAFFLLVHRPTEEGAKNTKKKSGGWYSRSLLGMFNEQGLSIRLRAGTFGSHKDALFKLFILFLSVRQCLLLTRPVFFCK
jgi:hypothetical protein